MDLLKEVRGTPNSADSFLVDFFWRLADYVVNLLAVSSWWSAGSWFILFAPS